MDTAITWCRDNGWPPELLNACFFYPAIGSITYLSDEGGPTAVFNQTPGMHGMSPILPSEVALVFPKKNRLMIFNGAKFHGVMVSKMALIFICRISPITYFIAEEAMRACV